jgi:hypothetical protein
MCRAARQAGPYAWLMGRLLGLPFFSLFFYFLLFTAE